MRISDWSSDVCSSDLLGVELGKYAADDGHVGGDETAKRLLHQAGADAVGFNGIDDAFDLGADERCVGKAHDRRRVDDDMIVGLKQLCNQLREATAGQQFRSIGRQRSSRHRGEAQILHREGQRSEEHTSELQSLMRISYAVFCLKKKTTLI